jgi:hypothetical protein
MRACQKRCSSNLPLLFIARASPGDCSLGARGAVFERSHSAHCKRAFSSYLLLFVRVCVCFFNLARCHFILINMLSPLLITVLFSLGCVGICVHLASVEVQSAAVSIKMLMEFLLTADIPKETVLDAQSDAA